MEPRKSRIAEIPASEHARLAHVVMRRQATLSLQVASSFLILLFGFPLVNRFMPGLADLHILGFTLTWLFLGILFYPITWLLSWYFIKESDLIESECSDWRAVLAEEYGEPIEPEGVGDVKPAFIEDSSSGSTTSEKAK